MAAKAKESLANKGGGKAGKEDRQGGAAGHVRFECSICKATAPSLKVMMTHFEAKHPTIKPEDYESNVRSHDTPREARTHFSVISFVSDLN